MFRRVPPETALLAWCALVAASCAGCEEKTGIDALPKSLRPAPSAVIRFYEVKNIRCPYWVDKFPARDGQPGGFQCVNRATLRELCTVADCQAQPGVPRDVTLE